MHENTRSEPSATERRVRRLIVPKPSGFAPHEQIDWVHDADLKRVLAGPR